MWQIFWLGGISILVLLLFLSGPVLFRSPAANRLEAMNNIRQAGIALAEFESEYGRYPDASTIPAVQADTGTPLAMGDGSSNQLFRQMIATGLKSEKPFWAKTAVSPRKPDEISHVPGKALQPGEVGFTYITGLSSKSHPETPVLLTPVIPGTFTFDPEPLKGYAVVLHVNGAVMSYPIDRVSKRVIFGPGGMDIFDPRQPFWSGKKPEIRWPE